jgi:hypothetical protein
MTQKSSAPVIKLEVLRVQAQTFHYALFADRNIVCTRVDGSSRLMSYPPSASGSIVFELTKEGIFQPGRRRMYCFVPAPAWSKEDTTYRYAFWRILCQYETGRSGDPVYRAAYCPPEVERVFGPKLPEPPQLDDKEGPRYANNYAYDRNLQEFYWWVGAKPTRSR